MLVSPDLDKRAKSYTRSKIRAEITIENNRGKTLEKEKLTNRLTNERSLSVTNGRTTFVKRNVRMNVRYLTEPRKTETKPIN